MQKTFPNCAGFTSTAEGGFVDNSADPGGATCKGVTFATFTKWREDEGLAAPSLDDLKALSTDEYQAIFGTSYWNPVQGDALPSGVDMSVSDFAFNAGTKRAAMLLQQSVGLHGSDVDGWIGPQTIQLVLAAKPFVLIAELATRKALFYRSLLGFATFGHGWLNRTDDCRAASVALCHAFGAPVAPVPAPAPQPTADQLDAQYNPETTT